MKQQLAIDQDQLGNYHLIRLLGQGGSAKVYLAKHIYLDTKAAIKVLNSHLTRDEIRSFHSEARLLASMRHRHIVRVLDFGLEELAPFLAMDYAPHGTLRQHFPAGRPLPLDIILPYIVQIADALQYVHNRNLIHCDIKPENILLGPANEAWLSDFGIARVADHEQPREVKGTPAYMAPEQILRNPLPASDQYALAVLLYTWLRGELPFSGTPLQICSQHLNSPPPRLRRRVPSIAPAVEDVVMQALAKDPSQRFATIKDFAQALKEASQEKQPLVLSQVNLSPKRHVVHKIVPSQPTERPVRISSVETPQYAHHLVL
jgi:eukaryotic-like serine/threonine-protein kinase